MENIDTKLVLAEINLLLLILLFKIGMHKITIKCPIFWITIII